MFSPNQISEILQIINYQHILFIGTNVGIDVLSDADIFLLEQSGFDVSALEKAKTPFDEMFRFGMLSSALGYKKTSELNYSQFTRFLRDTGEIKLTEVEELALLNAKKQASSDIRGLGNRIEKDTEQILIEFDQNQRREFEQKISEQTQANISERGSISDLVSRLGHKTGDWARDFGRISDYVMHQAFENGRAEQILREHGEDAEVYKNVYEKACKHCVRLYLTKDVGSEPILFKLKDLMANGTNIGRKPPEWKAVVGPTHPHSITDGRTPVLTDNGYKPIKDVEVGDYVLTHKGRFRKVLNTIKGFVPDRSYPYRDFYKIYFTIKGNKNRKQQVLNLTAEHKVYTQRGWVEVRNLHKEDKLIKLLKPCSNPNCDNMVDFGTRYKKTCSIDCEKEISKINCIKIFEGENSEVVKDKISKTISNLWKNTDKYNNVDKTLRSESFRIKNSERMKNGGAISAMKSAFNPTSKIQQKLFNRVKKYYPDAELEFSFFGKSLDIAIPSLKVNIEYDGSMWHKDLKKDEERDSFIKSKGWHVLRYRDHFPKVQVLLDDVTRVSSNSCDKYSFEEIEIDKIEKGKISIGNTKLWDIEVEEDESFIAKGVVIHNCRCTIAHRDKNYDWDESTQSYNKPKEYTPRVQRSSRIRITIGDTTIQA